MSFIRSIVSLQWREGATSFLTNPMFLFGILIVFVLVIGFLVLNPFANPRRVLYFSESDRVLEVLEVDELLSSSIKTEGDKRFIRNSIAYNWKDGLHNITTWLGKRGTAYLFKIEDTETGKGKVIGNLWDGLISILGIELVEQFTDEVQTLLRTSEVYLTVELEHYDISSKDNIDEVDIDSETNREMAALIARAVKNVVMEEDWIRNMGLIGIGVALTFVAKSLGLITV